MRFLIVPALVLAALGLSATAHAVPGPNHFKMVCYYDNQPSSILGAHCRVAADLIVTLDAEGGEILDPTTAGSPVTALSVSCDANPHSPPGTPLNPLYNGPGVRFTTLLGTKIMGATGPTPSIFINRGELHDGHHVAESYFEATVDNQLLRSTGVCEIWSEPGPI